MNENDQKTENTIPVLFDRALLGASPSLFGVVC